jgi:hypothetical protein
MSHVTHQRSANGMGQEKTKKAHKNTSKRKKKNDGDDDDLLLESSNKVEQNKKNEAPLRIHSTPPPTLSSSLGP